MVDIAACAVCASDLHAADGSWGGSLPAVYGHEAAGVVATVGQGVASVVPGDRVVVSLLRSCRSCFFCDRGDTHLCEGRNDFALASSTRLHTDGGDPVAQGVYTGAFAEAVVVHHSQLAPVPDDVGFDAAALMACGVATGLGAALRTHPVEPGSTVAVIGAGGVGLNTIQGSRIRGASTIIALDLSAAKLDDARLFGATDTVAATDDDAAAQVRSLSGGRGVDAAYVTVGSTAAMEQAVELCRNGGAVVVVGLTAEGHYARFETSGFASGEKRMIGSFLGSTDLERDVPEMVALYRSGELLLDELVSRRFPLEQINDAIAATAAGTERRTVVDITSP